MKNIKGIDLWNELLARYSEEELKKIGYEYDKCRGVLYRKTKDRFEAYVNGIWFSIPI